jgi:hypothetical protein
MYIWRESKSQWVAPFSRTPSQSSTPLGWIKYWFPEFEFTGSAKKICPKKWSSRTKPLMPTHAIRDFESVRSSLYTTFEPCKTPCRRFHHQPMHRRPSFLPHRLTPIRALSDPPISCSGSLPWPQGQSRSKLAHRVSTQSFYCFQAES